ncbi:hypothetical protein AB4Y45_29815 [Paraburkholderia sp. EG287A]|uniref:hypothetical protein n=1 Tax=unclassified Paraburkholderia TaxID=2615204 RepID=UPI0034D253A5
MLTRDPAAARRVGASAAARFQHGARTFALACCSAVRYAYAFVDYEERCDAY